MPPCQGGCREFEPRLPLHKEESQMWLFFINRDNSETSLFANARGAEAGAFYYMKGVWGYEE